MHTLVTIILVGTVALSCAAGDGGNSPGNTTRRDSAGVEIVEIPVDLWSAPAWATVDTTNVVRIRPVDSIPATLFGTIGSTDRLSDGSIVTLDWTSGQVHIFSATGTPLRSIGRTGQGPGELQYPVLVIAGPGDTVHVINPAHALDVFAASGLHIRSMPLRDVDRPLIALNDGTYIVSSNENRRLEPGRIPLYNTIYRLTPTGEPGATLARYLVAEHTYRQTGTGSHQRALQLFQPFRYAAGITNGFVWCDGGTFVCDIWSAEGAMMRSVRVTNPLTPVTSDDIAQYRNARLERAATPQVRSEVEQSVAEADVAATFPAFAEFRSDGGDRLWFKEYTGVEGMEPSRWLVLQTNGDVLGTIALPAVYRVSRIGSGYVIAIERDEDGQESVVVFTFAVVRR